MRPSEVTRPDLCWSEDQSGEAVRVLRPAGKRFAIRIRDIRDGTSKTICVGESAYLTDEKEWPMWHGSTAEDESILFKTELAYPINCMLTDNGGNTADASQSFTRDLSGPDDCAASWHDGGAQFAFCDGSVRLITDTIDVKLYELLGDRRDGSVVNSDY